MTQFRTLYKQFFTSSPFLFLLGISIFLAACKKDGGEEIRDPNTQMVDDEASLVTYLQTHFYNYEDFQSQPDNYDLEIIIDTIAGENAGKTPLFNQVQTRAVDVTYEGEFVPHTMYYLTVREGVKERPSKVDSVYVTYKGNLTDGTVFDNSTLPIWFNLTEVVPGFREGVSTIGAGEYTVNADGTYNFFNYGQTIFFMPSGLGYYSRSQGAVPAYAPLVFRVSLYTSHPSDHDGDGIPSGQEDIDGDGNPFNDDTDGNGVANMRDPDDDGDGILTRNELDNDGDGVYDDSDNDGIPDYLDAD